MCSRHRPVRALSEMGRGRRGREEGCQHKCPMGTWQVCQEADRDVPLSREGSWFPLVWAEESGVMGKGQGERAGREGLEYKKA